MIAKPRMEASGIVEAEQTPSADRPVLYWSARGEVACQDHTPADQSSRWVAERWAIISEAALDRRRTGYQCQHCSASGTALRRDHRSNSNHVATEPSMVSHKPKVGS